MIVSPTLTVNIIILFYEISYHVVCPIGFFSMLIFDNLVTDLKRTIRLGIGNYTILRISPNSLKRKNMRLEVICPYKIV